MIENEEVQAPKMPITEPVMGAINPEPPFFRSLSVLNEYCLSLRPSIVSLDFFDTLVYREALSPECIFHRMIKHDIAKKCGLDCCWAANRQKAARRMAYLSPRSEVTLKAIYNFLVLIGTLPRAYSAQIMEIELLEERKCWRPNLEMLSFAEALKKGGTSVIIYSDTYLPSNLINEWINHFLPGVAVYCSSETKCTKTSGRAFRYLKARYPGAKILHIGDSLHSDGMMPRRMGIESAVVDRQGRFSSTLPSEVSQLARLRGLNTLPSFPDGEAELGTSLVVAQWAYGWALFLISFLEAIARFIKAERIEEVWFTSRDCETIFKCLAECEHITEFPNAIYIHTSGSSLAPLITPLKIGQESEERRLCERYIRTRLSSASSGSRNPTRLLVVDIGGRGTLQRAIETTLGDAAIVHGFYVAIHPTNTWLTSSKTSCFLKWNRATFCEPLTELMFGFVGDRCVGYKVEESGHVVPSFETAHGDASDAVYTLLLRRYLRELLKENWGPAEPCSQAKLTPACSRMVQRFHMYPKKVEASAISHWSYKSRNGSTRSIGGDGLKLSQIILMRGLKNNYWPHGAVAVRLQNRVLIYILQWLGVHLRHIKRLVESV